MYTKVPWSSLSFFADKPKRNVCLLFYGKATKRKCEECEGEGGAALRNEGVVCGESGVSDSSDVGVV